MTSRIPRGGLSLYVHVPFCASKCSYCDFYSLPMGPGGSAGRPDDTAIDGYLSGLRTLSLASPLLDDVPTLYVGGGTPSVLGERLTDVFRCLRVAGVVLRPGAEVTVEANPESVTPRLLALLAEEGVTRVSLGIQSFDDEVLEILGRCHDAERARSAARAVTEAGFRLSIDLMCGIPGQSYEDLAEDILWFARLDLDMIGVGPYIPHPATALGRGELPEASPGEQVPNTELMTYKVVALARLVDPDANIPSTTALATLNLASGRELGLSRGANVVMPNLTPTKYRALYEIYPAKACIRETAAQCGTCLSGRIVRLGRTVGKGPGGRKRRA